MNARYSNFNPDSDIPSGADFLNGIIEALPSLSPSARTKIAFIAGRRVLSIHELKAEVIALRDNPSNGGALFQLGLASDRILAWLAKDYALETAQILTEQDDAQLASLLFVELFAQARTQLRDAVMRKGATDVNTFVPVALASLTEAQTKIAATNLPPNKLKKILQFRSIENELMQTHEGKLTDEELSEALAITVSELAEVKRLNATEINWHPDDRDNDE